MSGKFTHLSASPTNLFPAGTNFPARGRLGFCPRRLVFSSGRLVFRPRQSVFRSGKLVFLPDKLVSASDKSVFWPGQSVSGAGTNFIFADKSVPGLDKSVPAGKKLVDGRGSKSFRRPRIVTRPRWILAGGRYFAYYKIGGNCNRQAHWP